MLYTNAYENNDGFWETHTISGEQVGKFSSSLEDNSLTYKKVYQNGEDNYKFIVYGCPKKLEKAGDLLTIAFLSQSNAS